VRYLLLIYENEDTWRALPSDERRRQIEGYDDVRRRAETAGHLVAAGPFADTKEHLGGFYLVECDEAEALAYAAAIPAAVSGSVEVRPVGVPH
jgi:hypothetical protein